MCVCVCVCECVCVVGEGYLLQNKIMQSLQSHSEVTCVVVSFPNSYPANQILQTKKLDVCKSGNEVLSFSISSI